MRHTPISLLRGGRIFARLGSPLASAVQQEKVARMLLAKASSVFVVTEDEGSNERRRAEYSDGARIPRAVLCGRERRAIFAFYPTVDWEWFARVARRLYLPAVVRNPRTMFSKSRSTFETTRRRVTADHLDLVIALGETNPLEFAVFMSCPKSAREVYRILSVEAKVPKKWSRFGGLTVGCRLTMREAVGKLPDSKKLRSHVTYEAFGGSAEADSMVQKGVFTQARAAANPAIAFRLQSTRPVGRVAELGSLAGVGEREAMSEDQKQKAPRVPPAQIARLICGIILFGVLMGTRAEFHSFWMRALVAGCAGAALGIFVLPLRKYRRGDEHDDGQQDAGPNDEERGQPRVPTRMSLARSSSSVSFTLADFVRTWHMKPSVVVVIVLGVVLFAGALASWFFVRATASDANGAYWADASKVSVTPTGYVTNAAGEVSAILAITNAGPYTFWYSGHVDTFDGRHWVNYPTGDIYIYTPCDSLLTPFSSASMVISVPSSQIRWRADLQLRDVHGNNAVARLTCLWEKFVKKDYKNANIYTEE